MQQMINMFLMGKYINYIIRFPPPGSYDKPDLVT